MKLIKTHLGIIIFGILCGFSMLEISSEVDLEFKESNKLSSSSLESSLDLILELGTSISSVLDWFIIVKIDLLKFNSIEASLSILNLVITFFITEVFKVKKVMKECWEEEIEGEN